MHKLGNHIELIIEPLKDNSKEYVVAVYRNKYKDYVVNKIIFDFLQQFKEPNTLESVTQKYLILTQAKEEQEGQVVKQLTIFFNDLVKKGWIVDASMVPKIIINDVSLKKGDIIDNYKILKVLAENELTDVYLAKLPDKRKKFVIKYLNSQKFKKSNRYDKYAEYLLKEFMFLKNFNSIYINKGIEFKNEPNRHYMVLQYINGKSLYRYVKKNRLSTIDKTRLVTKVLRGFSLIHEKSIYHGDIHLSNILVTPKGQVKIIDFGYSNSTENTKKDNQKIRNGGVHAFIPPERALRSINRKFNAVEQFQSEVYQIGLLIYYVFVRNLPFEAETWKTMVDEKSAFNINNHLPFLNRRMPKIIRQFISKSLEKNPENRYDSAMHMLKEWSKITN